MTLRRSSNGGIDLRILLICDYFPSYGTKSVRFLANALMKQGHTVLIASSDVGFRGENIRKHDSQYHIYRYPSVPLVYVPYTYTIRASYHLRKLCEKFKPDIVHTHFMMYWLSLSSASLADAGWPVVLTLHGLTLPSEPSGFFGRFALDVLYQTMGIRLVSKSNAIVCVSKNVKEKLGTLYPHLQKLVEVIPNGLDMNEDTLKVKTPRDEMRSNLGLTGKRVFIYLGRVTQDKGVLELAHAFRVLRRKKRNVALLIVGTGSEIMAMRNILNGVPDVHFAGYRTNVGDYLNASDIAVLPSYREGLPTSLLEAMFHGLPFISTMVGGIQDLQDLGARGITVPAKSRSALSSAMIQLASTDKASLQEWGRSNRELASTNLVWDAIVERIIGLYQKVVDAHSQKSASEATSFIQK